MNMTDDGLELAFSSGVMFASGSADVLPQMREPLNKVLAVLGPYAQKYKFAVEGHTDEVPISSARYRSNWELSSERAMQIREQLERIGVPRASLRVEAYADAKPLTTEQNIDPKSDAQRAKLRRVTIRLY